MALPPPTNQTEPALPQNPEPFGQNFSFASNIDPTIHTGLNQITGKILYVDTSAQALNFHTRYIGSKNRVLFQCPFCISHKMGSAKKYAKHLKKCINNSSLGLNGIVAKNEAKKWIRCKYNEEHFVHKCFLSYHYQYHCASRIF